VTGGRQCRAPPYTAPVEDPNLRVALVLGHGLAPYAPPLLPAALEDVRRRAEFVVKIDCTWLVNGAAEWAELGRRLEHAAEASDRVMPEVASPLGRMSIALRLWAGCLNAAKSIAAGTLSGPNSPEGRAQAFEQFIDPTAIADPVFRAGVEAAPTFHALHGNPCFLDGVPADSAVRLHAEQCTETSGEAPAH
jgi:hypothetical protein